MASGSASGAPSRGVAPDLVEGDVLERRFPAIPSQLVQLFAMHASVLERGFPAIPSGVARELGQLRSVLERRFPVKLMLWRLQKRLIFTAGGSVALLFLETVDIARQLSRL